MFTSEEAKWSISIQAPRRTCGPERLESKDSVGPARLIPPLLSSRDCEDQGGGLSAWREVMPSSLPPSLTPPWHLLRASLQRGSAQPTLAPWACLVNPSPPLGLDASLDPTWCVCGARGDETRILSKYLHAGTYPFFELLLVGPVE